MKIVLGDITKTEADAIVNAAATDLRPCEGICQAIFRAADGKELLKACKAIGHCPVGRAVVTPSFGLPCKYIIHVAGSGWYSGHENDLQIFRDCYRSALQKAYAYRCKSVALPLMFSGSMHVPRVKALRLVAEEVSQFERDFPGMEIMLVLYKQSIYDAALCVMEELHLDFEI